jgi:dimethylglycine dehydrogenase
MKSHYRALVIGGGVVGASVLYHLAKLGWRDVLLVERSELTSGSTWHAAAGFHALNGDPNVAALQQYTISLYPQIERESGVNCGLHMIGGVNVAATAPRWEALRGACATFHAMGIDTARLMSREEIADLTRGIIVTDDLLGGLYDSNEGYLDPNGTTQAYVGAARKHGAEVVLRNRVLALHPHADGGWTVETEQGSVHAEHVVNAAGLWAKQVGRMAGVELPVAPMEHHYMVTDRVPELDVFDPEMPIVVDLDGFTYTRQERDGLLLGLYERQPRHWHIDGAPWDFGMALLAPDVERILPELSKGLERFPALQRVGIRRWVNGAFTFSPDGNPLIGPVGPRGYWVACAVMAGFSQGGGVGKSLAEWMVQGSPQTDVWGMDVARFGPHQCSREYIRQTTAQFYARRFVMTFPNEQLPAARPLRVPGAYREMTDAGARWMCNAGLELPMYFANDPAFTEPGTLRRNAAFPIVAAECAAVRDHAGLLDITGFSRWEFSGVGVQAALDRLLSGRLPTPGRVRLAPMLGTDGRLKGDLSVLRWPDGRWWLMGSYGLRSFHRRWFQAHLGPGVAVQDLSDAIAGFSISGPRARDILQRTTDFDLSTLAMMQCVECDVGLLRARVARISLAGELAYEINVLATEHATLRRILLEAGAVLGLREIGFNAMFSLRLEKSVGIWNLEYTQGRCAAMTGLGRWIDWSKGDFIGRAAARAMPQPQRRLVTLRVEATDADCSGFEPLWLGDRLVGMTTSGGWGHRIGASLALAMVDSEHGHAGTQLEVQIVGDRRIATVIPDSPYDPSGRRMRA